MKIHPTPLIGAHVLEAEPIRDERGSFTRLFCENDLAHLLDGRQIAQVNHSYTRRKGTLRGLHFQHPPETEIKIVRCLVGRVFDVMVDLRAGSATFLQWYGVELSAANGRAAFIPEGFAHGFQTLREGCELLYMHTAKYSPMHEAGLRYNDPKINISWPISVTELSQRDQQQPLLGDDFPGVAVTNS